MQKIDTWNLCKHDVSKKIYSLQPENYAELCAAIYSAYADKAGKGYEYWGDKNNYYLNHLNELINVYPNAKFLHIVRDGRDIACSYREVMTNKSTSPYAPELETQIQDIAHIWKNDITKIDDFYPCYRAVMP
ncbi:MAG: sulfotransferase [Candidatus Sedimenticola sp. (ex Thyasira tokunagai)]